MLKADDRRCEILRILSETQTPVSATQLAVRMGVSRQIIVGDVALLRASGTNITATPRGYVLQEGENQGLIRRIACLHDPEHTAEELYICVDQGCEVRDVIVEHPVYGQLTGTLAIRSRYDVEQFIQKVNNERAHALSELTDGIHLHTLLCPDEEAFQRVRSALKDTGILLDEDEL